MGPEDATQARILILGAGLSGLVLANLVDQVSAEIVILEQDLPPGRSARFHGVVTSADLEALHLEPGPIGATRIDAVEHMAVRPDESSGRMTPSGWWSVEHHALLDGLRQRFEARGGRIVANRGEAELVWRNGVVGGLRLRESGSTFDAGLVAFADESDPRLVERLGLRPDWPPTQLMHLAKQRYDAPPGSIGNRGELAPAVAFGAMASWGSPGYALIVPGRDAITVKVAMLLEDEMATARHIREYLDEVLALPFLKQLLDEFEPGAFVTECVPIGGFDRPPRFHADGVLVVNDLLGLTHPMNRDGLSTTLAVCHAAVSTIGEAVISGDVSAHRLAAYSRRLGTELVAPVNRRRRPGQAAWPLATLTELAPALHGVTAGANSAKLSTGAGSRLVGRLRTLGRRPGVIRRHPGALDDEGASRAVNDRGGQPDR